MFRKSVYTLAFLLALLVSAGFAEEATLTDIIVTNTRDDLLLYLGVRGAFREKIESAILSGVPVSFSFIIDLQQERALWFDRTFAHMKVTHTIKYNNLKKEFTVHRSWQEGDALVTQSFEDARKRMTEIDGLKVCPLKNLEKGIQYQLRAKAELSKTTLPFYLHYVLFFVSLWDFETDWYEVEFIY